MVIALLVTGQIQNAGLLALIYAGVICTLNVSITLFFIKKLLKKPGYEFVKGFNSSVLIRLFLLLAIFFTIILKMPVNHFVFTVAFFILYFLFQVIEVYILHTYKQSGKF
jgi:hypothetical protein